MSSSVFIESSSVPKSAAETEASLASTGDSNLVVVYGKNGINFDRKGLESLIEEKTLSSISVIRLTSPTPSMEAEEEEIEKLEDIGSDEESDVEGERDTASEDEECVKSNDSDADDDSTGEDYSNSANEYDESANIDGKASAENIKNKKKSEKKRTSTKLQRLKRRQRRERPEIVGLTVEEFYTAEDANAVLKEALRKAGISTIKHSAEYEFQLYVIKNDHCYTPFTSPEQMKTKVAVAKPEPEKQLNLINRKALPPSTIIAKPIFGKKKVQQQPVEELRKPIVFKGRPDGKGKRIIEDKAQKRNDSDDLIDDDEEMHTSTAEEEGAEEEEDDEESEFFESEVSLETDNDRDSDLDFNINNRKGRKRKVKRNKRGLVAKTQNRRHKQSQDESDEPSAVSTPRTKVNRSISSDTGRPIAQKSAAPISAKVNTPTAAIDTVLLPKQISEAIAALPPIPKKQTVVLVESSSPSRQQQVLATAVRRGPIVQVGGTSTKSSKIHSSPQAVKEIVISKVMASPKGGFTDIGTLLAQSDNILPATPTTPTSSTRIQNKTSPSSKGFMPLIIETAAKNQLPAQISLQTHQSSSELAAEHDKQLDLIDSIVKNEMQKSSVVEQESSINENIPELVEMLESTAKALELNKMPPVTNYAAPTSTPTPTPTANEDDIDISNTQLLETPEDDITDDFLQHVVQLMKENFGDDSNEEVADVLSIAATPPPLVPILPQIANTSAVISVPQQTPQTVDQSSNSIIQAISNSSIDSPGIIPSASSSNNRVAGIHTPKTAPLVRKEPIQIIRGNGRVITLPPIEAPTTRAKRRAQAQPAQHSFSAASHNESSLDSSLQSNSSFTAAATSDTSVVAEKKPTEMPAKRRVSKESTTTAGTGKSTKKASAKKANASKSNANKDDNTEVMGSHGDDDDPNKLWCICRQPHNNRFMICCDVCEDWFHGTCVNITKAMGLQMEQKSIDWTCPKCVKAQEEKKQRKITDMLVVQKTPAEEVQEHITCAAITPTTPTASEFINANTEFAPATSTVTLKPEAIAKKQVIEIKKIQSGQFISLKALEQVKKSSSPAVTSGPKRMFPPSQTQGAKAGNSSSTPSQVKRVVVHKSKASPARTVTDNTTPSTQCIVCKKAARPNSIYCSDDCIRRHAQNALQTFIAKSPEPSGSALPKGVLDDKKKKAKGLFEDLLLMADRKPKVERVHVFERKSGRVLTGHSAPTTANLKKWLQDNPTFEVVQPGSVQALEIEKKQKQRSLHSAYSIANKNFGPNLPPLVNQQNIASPMAQSMHAKATPMTPTFSKPEGAHLHTDSVAALPKPVKQLVTAAKMSPNSNRPSTPKTLQKYPQQVSIRPDKVSKADTKDDAKAKEKAKRQSSDAGSKKHVESTPNADSEPIRLNVRRTLKEQLLLRINELPTNEAKLTVEEVEDFVTQTEAEMYSCFNRDTGSKYKAKYRSLMFNIKDRKNHTLFAKICAKQIEAKQLVHMSPEELASQELARWRENEAKHQLEMIKKSELDMLSCAKNYVLKTHKGEEVIEDKMTDRVNLDLTIPVEDVVSVLNNDSALTSSEGDLDKFSTNTGSATKKDYIHSSELSSTSSYYQVENVATEKSSGEHAKLAYKEKEREKERERAHDRERRHKSKDRHRDKSRSRRRSRSRSRSRSHSKEKRRKSSQKDDRRERDERRDRSAERERGYERARDREHKDEVDRKSLEKKTSIASSTLSAASTTAFTKSSHGKDAKKKAVTPKPLEAFSLIDQILESSKTIEEAANLVTDKEPQRQPTPPPPTLSTFIATLPTQEQQTENEEDPSAEDFDDCDEEPTSTVSISTPPQDPYLRYSEVDSLVSPSDNLPSPSSTIWGGNINMIDVASFQIILQSVVGNAVNLGKLLPLELDVVGRIGPDTVWDYISKIKKSPNKEIVIIRLVPSGETETSAYTILYQYLDKRKRLGVIKTTSSQIKDFYIYPLGADKHMPPILQSPERVDFYEDVYRPDMLVGIVIRVIGKRNITATVAVLPPLVPAASGTVKFPRGPNPDADSFTPPGSPKRRKTIHSTVPKGMEFDIDAIIKAPIAAKTQKSSGVVPATPVDDADEPYSPGGSSDDDVPPVPVKTPSVLLDTHKAPSDELKRKMDELNRQIAAQEMEIAGLLNVEPSRYVSSSTKTSTVLANISIPSNLSQILASIKSKPEAQSTTHQTTIPPPPHIGSLIRAASSADDEEYNPEEAITKIPFETSGKLVEKPSSGSRLAQLSEAELLSMVPDDMLHETSPPIVEKKSRFEEPPPPGV